LKPKTKNGRYLEDYEIRVKPLKCDNPSSDIWSLGIIILEIYLSLFIHKKDCREMVHNLYLNKLTYQSRCIIINEILDNSKNPIFCSLIKEMLRDSEIEA
jgi:serine/threonine protein kinase